MATVGYHASHEQFPPGELLEYTRLAERAGFQAAMCSDHFKPWSKRQGHSGFAWAWLGAALQATSLPFGVVTVPGGWRYHPAVLAQAAATLTEMFPGRFWLAPGSGEQLNEHIVGRRWPEKSERNARLEEGVSIMRALWTGETVSRRGVIEVEEAVLYVRTASPPPVIGAALTPRTAHWMGSWADGLITVNKPHDKMKGLLDAFRNGGGEGKPVYLQAHLSYAQTEDEARAGAHDQWRNNVFPSSVLAELRTPEQFDAAGELVQESDLEGHIRISSDIERHIDWLQEDLALGFNNIYLHNVNLDQRSFIQAFGKKVLPRLVGS